VKGVVLDNLVEIEKYNDLYIVRVDIKSAFIDDYEGQKIKNKLRKNGFYHSIGYDGYILKTN
jgi:hypothetical protein